jgi:hypothetical protein
MRKVCMGAELGLGTAGVAALPTTRPKLVHPVPVPVRSGTTIEVMRPVP